MAVDKSGWNKNIKVSQSTINDIKKMGMTKALKLAGQNAKASQGGLVKEYQEATRRLYGEKRFAAATGKTGTAGGGKAGTTVKPPVKSPDAARSANKPKVTTTTKTTPTKKSGTSVGDIAKVAAGTAAAAGLLIASRGRATGVAAKLAPQFAKSGVGKAIMGNAAKQKAVATQLGKKFSMAKETASTSALAKSGQAAAKRGKAVSQSQYDAMVAAAKAKGIKAPTADAAKKAAGAVKKSAPAKKTPPTKKPPVKKATAASVGMGASGKKK